jgi:hypothetical protein
VTTPNKNAADPGGPAFVVTYGRSGVGKTTDQGYSFPNALFLAAPGALKPLPALCGFSPKVFDCATIDAATKAIEAAAKAKTVDAIVVDDFSFMAEHTFNLLENKFSGYKLWGKLREYVLDFRAAARYAGIHVVVNCWEQVPMTKPDGTRIRGGPKLSGDLPEQLPAMADLVLRATFDPARRPWGAVYRCDGGLDWTGKDRDAGTPSPAPLNLGEILRLNGYRVSRLPTLPWQEEVVAGVAAKLLEGAPEGDGPILEAFYADLTAKGIDPRHARWTIRDAWDRATLTRAKATRWATFF